MVGAFDAPAYVCDREPGSPGPLGLGRRANALGFQFLFQYCSHHIVGLLCNSCAFNGIITLPVGS